MKSSNKKYYLMLLAVIALWGIDPVVNSYLYEYYSAAALSALLTLASAVLFLVLARKTLVRKNLPLLRIAIPVCLINSLACVLQRIGLQYTSPARYAFFEHLSCVTVPLILLVCFRKKPSLLQILSALLCLGGCLLLAGEGAIYSAFGIGDLLCMLAGVLIGAGIVATAKFTKGMDIGFFTAVHMCVYFLTSLSLALALHFIPIGGASAEPIKFSFSPLPLVFAVLFGMLTVGICWLMRNEATRHLHPTAIAVLSPLSAVITATISVLLSFEKATPAFFGACALILAAAILAGLGENESPEKSPKKKKSTSAE